MKGEKTVLALKDSCLRGEIKKKKKKLDTENVKCSSCEANRVYSPRSMFTLKFLKIAGGLSRLVPRV